MLLSLSRRTVFVLQNPFLSSPCRTCPHTVTKLRHKRIADSYGTRIGVVTHTAKDDVAPRLYYTSSHYHI